jgi:oxygen-independent coproporphyrinogen-3 oxidase
MAGLYIHIPFCRRKCPYCDFYSVEACAEQLQAYPQLLALHLEWAARHGWGHPVDTIYFGGGTPSLLSPEAIGTILEAIDRHYSVADEVEVSLEANPGTVNPDRLRGYRSAGVNRLSLGLQSSSDRFLKTLGRLHDRNQGVQAYTAARQAGFDNISLDLMFALPGQTLTDLEQDLRFYCSLESEHLSCYGLAAEPHTPLHAMIEYGQISLPGEDLYTDAFLQIHNRLTDTGYAHYEISNYARSGFVSRHNSGYWQRRPCLGVGAGAHSYRNDGWGSRWAAISDLPAYQQALQGGQEPMQCLETFDRDAALRETVYLGLRTKRGVVETELERRFGCRFAERFPRAIETSRKWLANDHGRWSMTTEGWLLYDRLILSFLE